MALFKASAMIGIYKQPAIEETCRSILKSVEELDGGQDTRQRALTNTSKMTMKNGMVSINITEESRGSGMSHALHC